MSTLDSTRNSNLDQASQHASATSMVAGLLSHSKFFKPAPPKSELRPGILGLRSSDFESFKDFKSAYLGFTGPVLCFLMPNEVPLALDWLRATDDIALIGEPESLTEWRLNRIAESLDQRLDRLTKVFVREELINALKPVCANASPFMPASLILTDIDRFKAFNDTYGVPAGNQVLEELGKLIKTVCENAFVARTRGGEFAILVEANGSITKQIASIIHETMTDYDWNGESPISSSFGVATIFEKCEPNVLLTQADEALFAAKANGRNQVVCYDEITGLSQMGDDPVAVINLENKARVLSERVTSFVTQQSKRILTTLQREANTDGLTQLFNRRYFDKHLLEEFNQAVSSHQQLSLAMLDIDHFGQINKAYGWPTGDKALCDVSAMIAKSIRATDWIGRYGGEEMCVVMPGTSIEHATSVCDRIRSSIESMNVVSTSNEPLHITVSIGVVELNDQVDKSAKDLIERVSQLTLLAKAQGRNQVRSASQ